MIDNELCKVPWNQVICLIVVSPDWVVRAKKLVHGVCFRPIDFDFGEEREFNVVLTLSKGFNLSVCTRLLPLELVAGEG